MTSSSCVFANMYSQTKSTIFGHLDCTIKTVETKFNEFAASIDFTAFCIIYVFVLIWALRKFNRKGIFRPKNKELVGNNLPMQIGKRELRRASRSLLLLCHSSNNMSRKSSRKE